MYKSSSVLLFTLKNTDIQLFIVEGVQGKKSLNS